MAQVISLYGVQTLQPTTDNNFSLIVNTNTRGENTNEVRLLVDTSAQVVASPVNIYLPTILSYNGFWTTQLYIVDISGTANARPIEIYATGGDTIDGSPMVSINNSYGNAVVLVANAGSWASIGSSGGGGGGGGGIVTTIYNDFYNLMSQGNLVAGTSYRITDYQSKNWLNGYDVALSNSPPVNLLAGSRDNSYNVPDNVSGFALPDGVATLPDGSVLWGQSNFLTNRVYKLDVNGVVDSAFLTAQGTGALGTIVSVKVQSSGKIIVGGLFNDWNGNAVGNIVRLNADGTYDATFTANVGTGFDNQVSTIGVDATDGLYVGGDFFNVNGIASNYFTYLQSNGTPDLVFIGAYMVGGGFNSVITQIIVQPDTNILVQGLYNQYNGFPTKYLTRIDPFANLDVVFVNNVEFGGGFNNSLQRIALQPDGSIVVIGNFTALNFSFLNGICRLLFDGTEDLGFSANIGTGFTTFNGNCLAIQNDGYILVGTFGGGTFNTFSSYSVLFRLDPFGSFDTTFAFSFPYIPTWNIAIQPTTGNILVGGVDITSASDNYYRLFVNPTPNTTFNARDIYTSPNIETLVVKALDNSNIEPIAFSEQYPQDIIEYLPQTNNLSFELDIYNGNVLPDLTVVAGFDLQWDGSRVYFDMPTGYPVQMGVPLYVFCAFNSFTEFTDLVCDPVFFGINRPIDLNGGEQIYSTIELNSTLTRIYLDGISFAQFGNYDANSLYVQNAYAFAPMKGWIARRNDTLSSTNYPADWRNQVYRRYQHISNQYTITTWWKDDVTYFYNGIAHNYTGVYEDCTTFADGTSSVNCEGGGGSVPIWFSGGTYNNVFKGVTFQFNAKYGMYANTFDICQYVTVGTNFTTSCFRGLVASALQSVTFSDDTQGILVNGDIGDLTAKSNFIENVFVGTFNKLSFGTSCQNNTFVASVDRLSMGDSCVQNMFINLAINNAVFGNSTNINQFVTSPITNWVSGLEFFSNIFNNVALNNTKIGDNCNQNTIQNGSWQSNDLGNSFAFNIILSPSFTYNVIGKLCTNNQFDGTSTVQNNNIGRSFNNNSVSNIFISNNLGSNYQNNNFGNNFQNCYGGNDFIGNSIGGAFTQNSWGFGFQNNNITGTVTNNVWGNETKNNSFSGLFLQNVFGAYCQSNNISSNQFTVNRIGEQFVSNFVRMNQFSNNTISANFGGNTIGTVTTNNFNNNVIGTEFTSNVIGNVNFIGNVINAPLNFDSNTIQASMTNNSFNGEFVGNIIAGGVAVSFRNNDVKTRISATDFTLATFVYAQYNKMIIEDNSLAKVLLYFDNATTSWISVTPVNS